MAMQKNTMSCFLDTSALIPLFKENHVNYRQVVRYAASMQTLWIDPVVLTEYLTGLPSCDRASAFDILSRRLKIVQLDSFGAMLAAEISDHCRIKGIGLKPETEKQKVKTDIIIIASAIAAGCSKVLHNDDHFTAIREAIPGCEICGCKIPEFVKISSLQPELFDLTVS